MFHFLLTFIFALTVYDAGPPPIVGVGADASQASQHIAFLNRFITTQFNRQQWTQISGGGMYGICEQYTVYHNNGQTACLPGMLSDVREISSRAAALLAEYNRVFDKGSPTQYAKQSCTPYTQQSTVRPAIAAAPPPMSTFSDAYVASLKLAMDKFAKDPKNLIEHNGVKVPCVSFCPQGQKVDGAAVTVWVRNPETGIPFAISADDCRKGRSSSFYGGRKKGESWRVAAQREFLEEIIVLHPDFRKKKQLAPDSFVAFCQDPEAFAFPQNNADTPFVLTSKDGKTIVVGWHFTRRHPERPAEFLCTKRQLFIADCFKFFDPVLPSDGQTIKSLNEAYSWINQQTPQWEGFDERSQFQYKDPTAPCSSQDAFARSLEINPGNDPMLLWLYQYVCCHVNYPPSTPQ